MNNLFDDLGVKKSHLLWAGAVVLLWLAIIISSGAGWWNLWGLPWDFSNPGAFGDSFGPLNTVMATIAAIGAIAAYRLQSKELSDARKRQDAQDLFSAQERERLLSREDEIDKRTSQATFESTFFKLLDTFRNIVSSIDVTRSGANPHAAHDAFQAMVSQLDNLMALNDGDIARSWRKLSGKFRNDLNHYFRFLYHIILFTHTSSQENKYFYVRLVRALLSESEIILLALNCQYGEGRDKFKELIEVYALLHNISPEAKGRWNLSDIYDQRAFNH